MESGKLSIPTANVMPSIIKRCLAAGMDDVLTKPYKRAEFAAKLSCVAKGESS